MNVHKEIFHLDATDKGAKWEKIDGVAGLSFLALTSPAVTWLPLAPVLALALVLAVAPALAIALALALALALAPALTLALPPTPTQTLFPFLWTARACSPWTGTLTSCSAAPARMGFGRRLMEVCSSSSKSAFLRVGNGS